MRVLLTYFFLLTLPLFANAQDNSLQQRWQFQEAYSALQSNALAQFEQLRSELNDYPIAHYLTYFYLRDRLATTEPATIQAFLQQQPDSPITDLLRRSWLFHLAKQRDWATYLSAYQAQDNVSLHCYALQARLATETDVASVAEPALALWTVGESQPKACDPVFDYLYKNNLIDAERRYERVLLTLQTGNFKLAGWLAKPLNPTQQAVVTHWQAMHSAPQATLAAFAAPDNDLNRSLLHYGLLRLVRTDAAAAHSLWQNLQPRYQFSPAQQNEISAEIAVRAEWQELPQAAQWLMELTPAQRSEERVWRTHLQLLLRQQAWAALLKLIPNLPESVRQEDVWQYWQARALALQQRTEEANAIYQRLAKERSYYGFLAADKLQLAYQFNDKPLVIAEAQQQAVLAHPGMIRARELLFVNLVTEARREWVHAIDTIPDKAQLEAAAALASQWGWHNRAIATVAKAGNYDDLTLRFPTPHYDAVLTYATQRELPYSLVYAVMRQESAFQADARSVANALGLMQLLPATAREVAQRDAITLENEASILIPDINIQLGTGYLRYLMDRFDNNKILVTAAYNAGPSRSIRWRREFGCQPTDIFVELIPFRQTRDYVQNIMAYMPIFEYRLLGIDTVQRLNFTALAMRSDCE